MDTNSMSPDDLSASLSQQLEDSVDPSLFSDKAAPVDPRLFSDQPAPQPISGLEALGRGVESTVKPIYTEGAALAEGKPFSQEAQEQEAILDNAYKQHPIAYGTGKVAGITGEAALAPESLAGSTLGDFASNAAISALGTDWSNPKNAAIQTAFGGGLGAGVGAAGRKIAETIAPLVESGKTAGRNAVTQLFGINEKDAADWLQKDGGYSLADRIPAKSLEDPIKGPQLNDVRNYFGKQLDSLAPAQPDKYAGENFPWSINKNDMMQTVDQAIQDSKDAMNSPIKAVMQNPEASKVTVPVKDITKNITDTDYFKFAPREQVGKPLIKLANLIDNIPELQGKADLNLGDLSLLRQKLYSLGNSAWDQKSLGIMTNAVDKASMNLMDQISNKVPEAFPNLKNSVLNESARYHLLQMAKESLPGARQPDYSVLGGAAAAGFGAHALGAPALVTLLPLMLMRTEIRQNLGPIAGISAGKLASAISDNPTWMKMFTGAMKRLGPQAGVGVMHNMLSKNDPQYKQLLGQ